MTNNILPSANIYTISYAILYNRSEVQWQFTQQDIDCRKISSKSLTRLIEYIKKELLELYINRQWSIYRIYLIKDYNY